MLLSVHDRLILLNLLPKEGDLTTLRIVRDLGSSLGFSEEEHKTLSLKQTGGEISWNTEVDSGTEIEIGITASGLLLSAMQTLDKAEKLTLAHVDLYERFDGGQVNEQEK